MQPLPSQTVTEGYVPSLLNQLVPPALSSQQHLARVEAHGHLQMVWIHHHILTRKAEVTTRLCLPKRAPLALRAAGSRVHTCYLPASAPLEKPRSSAPNLGGSVPPHSKPLQ